MTVSLHGEMPKSESEDDNETCCTEDKEPTGTRHGATVEELSGNGLRRKHRTRNNSINNNNGEIPEDYSKYRRLLTFEEAPAYLAHNKYIRTGYRGILSTKLCIESIFWWTNETINIWSHIFGFMLFAGLMIHDICSIDIHANATDIVIVTKVLICFMVCMILSSMYHTFSCRSERDFHCYLNFDLFGIAISLLAIYISGIYFAFWCHLHWQRFYIITVTLIFIAAMILQIPVLKIDSHVKMCVFVGWAAYGVLPTLHWTIEMGGLAHPVVELLLPRVLGMYLISGTAFFIYLTKIPERFSAGKFDFIGHSHQWWHIIIVIALYYWHCSGIVYVNYRINHACTDTMRMH